MMDDADIMISSETACCSSSIADNSTTCSNLVEATIRTMELNNRCMNPYHWHSFRPSNMLMVAGKKIMTGSNKAITCVFCQQQLSLLPSSSPKSFFLNLMPTNWNNTESSQQIVQCVACEKYAHRFCSTNTTGNGNGWSKNFRCTVNAQFIHADNNNDPSQTINSEHNLRLNQKSGNVNSNSTNYTNGSTQPLEKEMLEHQANCSNHQSFVTINQALQENVMANFLFDAKQKLEEQPHAIDETFILHGDNNVMTKVNNTHTNGRINHPLSNILRTPTAKNQEISEGSGLLGDVDPIIETNVSVRRNLLENVDQDIGKDDSNERNTMDEDVVDKDTSSTKQPMKETTDSEKVNDIQNTNEIQTNNDNKVSNAAAVAGAFAVGLPVLAFVGPISGACAGVAAASYLVKNNNPAAADCSEKKFGEHRMDTEKACEAKNDDDNNNKLNIAAVAGGIVGGLAVLSLAGPVGAYAGVMAASYLVEGSVALGIVAAGIATGTVAGVQFEQQILRNGKHLFPNYRLRILTISESGSNRKILLVRPHIDVDPLWANKIMVDARKTAPISFSTSAALTSLRMNPVFQSLYRFPVMNSGSSASRLSQRLQHNSDIIMGAAEDELSAEDKVLLFVNRLLNDRKSLAGHVFRFLLDTYDDRCRTRQAILASYNYIIHNGPLSTRSCRDDIHAIVKHVTATLLETSNDLASTPAITELTAVIVEGLVFSRLYDSVYEEIVEETFELDMQLETKILQVENQFHKVKANEVEKYSTGNEEDAAVSDDMSSVDAVEKNKQQPQQQSLLDYILSTMSISHAALKAIKRLPPSHAPCDKLYYCVRFLEIIVSEQQHHRSCVAADSLLKMVCQHIIVHVLLLFKQRESHSGASWDHNGDDNNTSKSRPQDLNCQIAFVEEFARDEQLLRGREGYALVTFQAALHFLNQSPIDDIVEEILLNNK